MTLPNTTLQNTSTLSPISLTPNRNTALRWYGLAVVVIILDQLSKVYFVNTLHVEGNTLTVIEPIFNFTLAYNYGAAFSFLADKGGWQKWIFSGLALMVSLGIMYMLWKKVPKIATVLSAGLALVMAGALGNLIDRVRLDYVVDFLHVHNGNVWHFPIFNVADVAINLGVALILFDSFFLEKKRHTG